MVIVTIKEKFAQSIHQVDELPVELSHSSD
jgi:hypothetical protein